MKILTRKDKKILQALDKNPRISFTQMGKLAEISKETAQYRYKRLITTGIIKGFWMVPQIDSSMHAYKVLLKSKGLSASSFEEIQTYLVNKSSVSWMAKSNGYWDIHVTLISTSDAEVCHILKELFTTYSHCFIDIQFHKALSVHSFHEKYLYDKTPLASYTGSFLDPSITIDYTNQKILEQLTHNARMTCTDIGKTLNLSPEAILARLKKVKSHIGMIKPRLNHELLGLSYYHLWIKLADGKKGKDIIHYCHADKQSVFIMEHIGKYHLHIEIVTAENKIEQYLSNLMKHFERDISEYDLCKIVQELKIHVKT